MAELSSIRYELCFMRLWCGHWALGSGQRRAELRVRAEGSMFCRPCILYSANDVTLLIRRYGTSDDRQVDNPFEGVSSVRTSTKEWSCSQDGT